MNQDAAVMEQAAMSTETKTVFGFWVYIMTDCVLFASLFATYAVLRNNTNGGPSGHDLFNLPYVLTETMALLTSSFTCGLAMIAVKRQRINALYLCLLLTFLFGAFFLGLELREFHN